MNWSKFWDVFAWICFCNVVIYLILKAAGILNSPFSIDFPTLIIIVISFFIGKLTEKVKYLKNELASIKESTKI
ncbi:hypothetical protein HYX16_01675 [Candidatus Woesearchaeota archaeon]|nr:hypothetical protein [Candidatus Woesearchaeota archaeon]